MRMFGVASTCLPAIITALIAQPTIYRKYISHILHQHLDIHTSAGRIVQSSIPNFAFLNLRTQKRATTASVPKIGEIIHTA